MRVAAAVFLTFFAFPVLFAQTAPTVQLDGPLILQKMSKRYAGANPWYIAATEERTSWNDYSRDWAKTAMIGAVSGNRYHFEGHSESGSALHISDGKTAWDLHPEEAAYTQEPAPVNGYLPPHPIFMNEGAAQRAVNLLKEFAALASQYSGATRLPDENLMLNATSIPCYVVRITSDQRKAAHAASYKSEETLWIEKATWAVRRTAMHEDSYLIDGTVHLPYKATVIATYSRVVLNGPLPESLFRFELPQNVKQIAKFSDNPFGPDLTGQLAADVELVGEDGKRVHLSSYRGKPVILDFWATWCAPCVEGMPMLAELEREAGPKGLVVLSIDEHDDVKKADAFLAQRKYTWPNIQDDGKIGEAFKQMAIPLYVLVDAQGTIVFYAVGTGALTSLRKAVAGLGPQFASLSDEPRPCQTAGPR